MNDYVVIIYNGEQVSVPKEVADFLAGSETAAGAGQTGRKAPE